MREGKGPIAAKASEGIRQASYLPTVSSHVLSSVDSASIITFHDYRSVWAFFLLFLNICLGG